MPGPYPGRLPRARRGQRRAPDPGRGRPRRHAVAARRGRGVTTRRGLQLRRAVLGGRLVGRGDRHHRGQRCGRAAAARGAARARARGALLPGVLGRDVRQRRGHAAARDHAVAAALALRGVQDVRVPHRGQLPGLVRHARQQRHHVQPRVAASGPAVRDAQDHRRSGSDQAGARRDDRAWQPRCAARLGLCGRLRRGDVADAAAGRRRRLRDRLGRGPHRARLLRGGLRARGPRLREARGGRPAVLPAGGRQRALRRPDEGQAGAGLGAEGHASRSW